MKADLSRKPSVTVAYWATVALIWSLALWRAWEVRALFGDGASFFIHSVRQDWFLHFYGARDYAMVASQAPVVGALKLGTTDLAWLARFFSFGVFGLPTAIYHLALARARRDAVLLSLVIAAIALVSMPTSFCAVGEYHASYALAVASAVWLVTADRLRPLDGLVIVLLAAFALRTYESALLFAPVLAVMALGAARAPGMSAWRFALAAACTALVTTALVLARLYLIFAVLAPLLGTLTVVGWRRPAIRPVVSSVLHLLAAALFIAGVAVAIHSLLFFVTADRLEDVKLDVFDFWDNPPFLLASAAFFTVAVWATVRPLQIASRRPYLWAGPWIVLLAVFPAFALVVADTQFRPTSFSQCATRLMGNPIILVLVLLIWACRPGTAGPPSLLRAIATLRSSVVGQARLLAFTCLALVATVPTDAFLTVAWRHYLAAVRTAVRTHEGVVNADDTTITAWPRGSMLVSATLTCQGLALRSRPLDAIVAPPRDYDAWVACTPDDAGQLTRFFWRDN